MSDNDPERRHKYIRLRMGVIGAFIVIGFLAVVGRVYYLQTVKREKLGEWSSDQTSGEVTLQASRGNILDRNGVEMAVTTDVPSIYARPKRIDRPKRQAGRLASHLEADRETLVEQLSSDRSFVWLERQTQPDSAEAIRQLEIRGVGQLTEHKRYYPLGPTAGQLLGFVGIDGNGLEGIERMLDDTLAGGDYELEATRDATGRTLLRKNVPDLGKLQGDTVRLTIDERIQRITREAVAEQVDKYNAKAGYGVVLDVDTGEVRALANTPEFDPNRFQEFSSEDWRLRTITDSFEPGSVFKPFVLAGALEEQTVSLGTMFDCEDGALQIGRHVIRDTHAHEDLTAAEIIQKSSNIGAYKIAQTIGKQRFYEYTKAFGFGTRTGIGIRGEQAGVVWPPERWADVTFANLAFGQGLSATPLQVATAVGAIANDGMLLEPRVVSEVRSPEGELERETEPRLVRQVVSEDVAEKVARTMSLVTTDEGTGTKAALDAYTVAGKTGTAQKVDPETGGYAPDKWIGSFVGFVPAEKPEFAILVMVDEPKETHYGGEVAGPAFREIARKSLAYEGVLPLPESERFDLGTADEEKDGSRVEGTREESGTPGRQNGDGGDGTEQASPERGPADEPVDNTTPGAGLVPDFGGMTLRSAMQQARETGVALDVQGWGQVVSQMPEPGRPVPESREVTLELSPQRRVGPTEEMPAPGSNDGE